MIEEILNLKGSNQQLKEKILREKNPRNLFLYAYFSNDKDLNEISKEILETEDRRYLPFFFRQIENIDLEKFFEKILQFDNKTIFYSLYDRKKLDDKFYIKGINQMILNGIDKYLYLTFYYYFVILNRYNEKIIEQLIYLNRGVNKQNYKEFLSKFRSDSKEKIIHHDEFTSNCYKGHNHCIPDMIICHISFDYGKIIKNFYDKNSEVSSHFAVSREGNFQQFVSLEDSAWANGTSLNPSSDVYYKFSKNNLVNQRNVNANYYTYSIENESIDGSLTKEQYKVTLKIMCKIIDYIKNEYGVDFKIYRNHIVGHQDINPIVRVSCPNDKFPLENLIKDLNRIYKKK